MNCGAFVYFFRGLDRRWGFGRGAADLGRCARWVMASRNRWAASGPSLKSSGPRCGLSDDEEDFDAIKIVYHYFFKMDRAIIRDR